MSDEPQAVLERMLADARRVLADAPREALGELAAPRRILGIPRAARIVRAGLAWHLGALLLPDDGLLATGEVIRAREEARRGFAAESQRRRAELAAAARRGGFSEGETVHLDWRPIDLAAVAAGTGPGPVALVDGVPSIRWSSSGGYVPLRSYLIERVELLAHPQRGAT